MRTSILLALLVAACNDKDTTETGDVPAEEAPVGVDDTASASDDTGGDTAPADDTGDTAPPTDPFAFDGIVSVSWDGADGLSAAWDAAAGGEGAIAYTLEVQDLDGVTVGAADITDGALTAEVTGLAEGEYRLRVIGADDAGATGGEDRWLHQLVAENRLVYRSEVTLPGAADVWGEGDVVVVAGWNSGRSFTVVDISDVENPRILHEAFDQGYVKDIKIGDGLMFTNGECGCNADSEEWKAYDQIGARIYDFSDPSEPTLLGAIQGTSSSVHNLAYGDHTLYLSDNIGDSVHAYDVTDPTDPAFLYQWDPPEGGFVHDQSWVDQSLYVAWWGGFTVLDVSEPAEPVETLSHSYEPSACHNAWPNRDGTHVLTTDETGGGYLRIWDISGVGVEEVGYWQTDLAHSVHNVHVRGDYAFVAWYLDGLLVLDISDPSNPQLVGWYDTLDEPTEPPKDYEGEWNPPIYDGAWGVWPYGDHVAVGDMQRGLILFDHFPEVVAWQPPEEPEDEPAE